MKISLDWQSALHNIATTNSGHQINIDGSVEIGGQNKGARPMEFLLIGLGGCTMIDVMGMLEKMHQEVIDVKLNISAKRAEQHPKVFTKIALDFNFIGHNLSEAKIQKAINLSAQKYCSASIMMGATADISHTIKLQEV